MAEQPGLIKNIIKKVVVGVVVGAMLVGVARALKFPPLFQIMFILQNASAGTPALPGLTTQLMDFDPEIARFDLTLELARVGEHLTGAMG